MRAIIDNMRRREFVGTGVAAAAQRLAGANDRVVVGLIGRGGRGRYVAGLMREAAGVEFGAVADVYLPNAERAKAWAGPNARAHQELAFRAADHIAGQARKAAI